MFCAVASSLTLMPARCLSTVANQAVGSSLKDPSLLKWRGKSSSSSRDFEVFDPADPESILATVPTMDPNVAIRESYSSLPKWRDQTTAAFRGTLLIQWSSLIKSNLDDLATIMTLESGKPLSESRGEVNYAASFLDYYAAEAVRATGTGGGFMVPSPFSTTNGAPRGHVMAIQQAVGVTALITPWNFPMAMITRKVGPALAAGCTCVVKPSELTPLSAIALKNLADRAGIPPNVFQVVCVRNRLKLFFIPMSMMFSWRALFHQFSPDVSSIHFYFSSLRTASAESTPRVGIEFCTNPLVHKISFTGSTRVGKLLMKQSSDTVKRMSLELGGNAPFVCFEDADVDQAVDAAMASKFRNAGQTCVCADRFLVHSSVHDEFVEKLIAKVKDIKVGPGVAPNTQMGPLISKHSVQNVAQKVQHAIVEGAKCELGGKVEMSEHLGPQFYPPSILTNVSRESDIWKTETFGPVAPIMRFDTEDEALEIANDSPVGLASYFCTRDLSRAFRFAQGYVMIP